jgi:hypothetical protein
MSPKFNRAALCLWHDGTAKEDATFYAAIEAAAAVPTSC